MYMYMYVCMYVCIYICMYIYIYICMYVYSVCAKRLLKIIYNNESQYYNFHFTKVSNSYINIDFIEKVNR